MDAATPYPAPRSSSEAVPDIETGIAAPLPLPTNAPQDQIREEEEELSGRPPTMVPASTKDNPDEDKVPVGAGDESPMPRCGEGVASTAFRASGPRTSGVHLQKDNEEEEEEDPLIVATRTQCLGLLRKLFYVVMPLSIVASIYACLYGWIFVNTPTYLQDPTSWQRCIVYNTNNANATPQNFAVSASAFGGMMFIFMGLGFKAGYLGLQDMDLLPYSLTVTCYTLLGQLVYRPVNPVVPAITELTPTLISLASFLRPGMYADVPDAAGACQHARRVNVSFLAFVLVLFAANFCNLLLLLYATYRTRRVPRSSRYLLVWHRPALCLVGLAIAAYIVTIAAKEDAALKTLFLLDKVGHGYLFPFQRPTLDTVGLFLLLTVASVVYGACKQEPESFKWASFTAYVHVLLSYPILISNFQAYHLYGFWTDAGCTHFLETDTTHAGGANRQLLFLVAKNKYPETERGFCRDTRVALVGQCAQFIIMHLAIGACLLVVVANWRMERPSMQLFGSQASSFLFPDPPTKADGEGGTSGEIPAGGGQGGEAGDRVMSLTPGMERQGNALEEPLLASGMGAGTGRGGGEGGRPLHHRRQSSGASSAHRGHMRRSSVNDHLLGPVLD